MMSEISNLINMDKSFLENLSKSELIKLVLKANAIKPIKIDTNQFLNPGDQFQHHENL